MFSKLSLCALFLFSAALLTAQTFEGVITYKISYENLPAEMAEYESMLPTSAISTMKGHMYKMEQPLSMGMKQVTIMDNKEESGVLLMDMMGRKNAIVLDKESRKEFEKEEKQPEFEYLNETKTIAGYECKKARMIIDSDGGEDVSFEVYYTDKIASKDKNQLRGLNGFPLHYSVNTGQFVMTFTAEKVDKKKVSEEEFAIPDGYEHITFEQFSKTFGQ
jgi:GLPGLI family protein